MVVDNYPEYIEVYAGVRYWEDATVNDVEDHDGNLIPFRRGNCWCPKIELKTGRILDWPEGVTADIHYKVCDNGRYWLLNSLGNRIASRDGYVPNEFLCHGCSGYGDYIIMTIDSNGFIQEYSRPTINYEDWNWINKVNE